MQEFNRYRFIFLHYGDGGLGQVHAVQNVVVALHFVCRYRLSVLRMTYRTGIIFGDGTEIELRGRADAISTIAAEYRKRCMVLQ